MTNLDIIKYLATNNPARLAELLDDLYCNAWNCGNYAQVHIAEEKFSPYEMEFSESKWLEQEANTDFFFENELEEWSKDINQPLILSAYYSDLTVTFPVKDPDHMWNNNNEYDYKESNQ